MPGRCELPFFRPSIRIRVAQHPTFYMLLLSRPKKLLAGSFFACMFLACGEQSAQDSQAEDICACNPEETIARQYRGQAKHVPISPGPAEEISVRTILNWEVGGEPEPDAPRTGRELRLFRIPRAFLQLAWVNPGDCDLHLEISETASRNAPRVIVETSVDPGFCPARQGLKQQLAELGEQMHTGSGELRQPRPVEVLGLAFQDFQHRRGSSRVATVWELHPAVVSLLPQ